MLQSMLMEAADRDDVSCRSYSGRFMYGKNCVALTGSLSNCMQIIAAVIVELREKLKTVQLGSSEEYQDRYFSEAVNTLMGFETDSMGRSDVVVYWPRVEWIEPAEDESEAEDQPA